MSNGYADAAGLVRYGMVRVRLDKTIPDAVGEVTVVIDIGNEDPNVAPRLQVTMSPAAVRDLVRRLTLLVGEEG